MGGDDDRLRPEERRKTLKNVEKATGKNSTILEIMAVHRYKGKRKLWRVMITYFLKTYSILNITNYLTIFCFLFLSFIFILPFYFVTLKRQLLFNICPISILPVFIIPCLELGDDFTEFSRLN